MTYAIDTLKLDGVVLLSNVEGHYSSGPEYKEFFAELNRRKLVVFVHSNDVAGMNEKTHDAFNPFVEYPIDVSRLFARWIYGGTLERSPDIRFILALRFI